MVKKYTGHEILQMALQIEQMGYDFYKNLVNHVDNKYLKNGYNWLAEEEGKHLDNFKHLIQSLEIMNSEALTDWEESSRYFKALIDTKVFPTTSDSNSLIQELKDEIGAIHIAISFEKDTILFWQELKRWIDPKHQAAIMRLIEEEKIHILKLLEMKKSVGDNQKNK